MKYKRLQILSVLLIGVFLFSASSQVRVATGQSQYIETNFEAWFFTQSGSRVTEAYALYIKQALAPLGIDVKVVAKPFGQFVGDLLHFTTGHPFDLAQVRFVGGGPTPGFMWAYHSVQTSFGGLMYQLDNPDWQAWQELDTGLKTADIDAMLEDLEFELNLTKRAELVDAFSELYMDKLLYDFPMVSTEFRTAMWAGYGGAANELWNQDEGIFASRAFGAGWNPNPAGRLGNATTLRLSQVNPNSITFDPMQGFDTATGAIVGPMSVNLLTFDFGFKAHPSIAYNWVNNDVTNFQYNATYVANVPFGNFTYYVRDDAFWPAATGVNGTAIPQEQVDAADFWFTHEIYTLDNVILNGQELFLSVLGTELSSTLYTNDTLKVYIDNGTVKPAALTPDDYFTFGAINPMPYHILGGDLTFKNATGTWVGDMYELDALGINVQNTEEWTQWASIEGHSLVGPYDIVDMVEGEFRSYTARDDWFFPNEWDAAAQSTVEGGVFGSHQNTVNPDAFNWAYNATQAAPTQKPTSQPIDTVFHIIIEDTNARLLAFESGQIDAFGSTSLGAQKVADHEADPRFVVKAIIPVRGPELLIFNLLHPDLKKLNVRKAIASVLDKDQLVRIHDGFAKPHHSPVWAYQVDWYKPFPVESSYETARDLMLSEGYNALPTNEPDVEPVPPPVKDVTSTITQAGSQVVENVDQTVDEFAQAIDDSLGSPYLVLLSGFAVITVSMIRRKRR